MNALSCTVWWKKEWIRIQACCYIWCQRFECLQNTFFFSVCTKKEKKKTTNISMRKRRWNYTKLSYRNLAFRRTFTRFIDILDGPCPLFVKPQIYYMSHELLAVSFHCLDLQMFAKLLEVRKHWRTTTAFTWLWWMSDYWSKQAADFVVSVRLIQVSSLLCQILVVMWEYCALVC